MDDRNNVAAMRLTPKIAEQRIRKLAAISDNVIWSTHAREQMLKREIFDVDGFRILREGYVDEQPQKTDREGEWKCKITLKLRGSRTAGVVVIILQNAKLFVKTVEWEDQL